MTEISINGTNADVSLRITYTSGMVGAKVKFCFSDDWTGVTKTAVFIGSGVTSDVKQAGQTACVSFPMSA